MFDGQSSIAGTAMGKPASQVTITQRLKNERDTLKARLADVETAIKAIEENPQVQSVIEAVAKVGYR